jgi:hypothetical protein
LDTIFQNPNMEPCFQTLSGQGVMTLEIPGENKLLPYQWRMLQENPIAGLLQISSIHRDSLAVLSWRVTSLQPLSLLFERRCRTVPDMMHLVRQLYRILSRMEGLLLDSERLLLDNRYMMADPVSMELQLAYVPLAECDFGANPVKRLLQQWIMGDCRLAGKESGGLPELVTMLNNPEFHWSHLGAVCNELHPNDNLPVPDACRLEMNPESKDEMQHKYEPARKNDTVRKNDSWQKNDMLQKIESSSNCASIRKDAPAHTGNPYGNRLDVSVRLPWKEGLQLNRLPGGKHGKPGILRIIALQVPVLLLLLFTLSGGLKGSNGTGGTAAWVGLFLVLTALEAFAFMRQPVAKEDVKVNGRERDKANGKAVISERIHPTGESETKRSSRADSSLSNRLDTVVTDAPQLPASCIDAGDFEAIGRTQSLPVGNGRHLQSVSKNGRQARMDLNKMPFLLGRYRDQVDGYLEHPAVGKIHAEIRETKDGLSLVDLNSKNGTSINGNSIKPYLAVPIVPGDIIRLANEELTYACDADRNHS